MHRLRLKLTVAVLLLLITGSVFLGWSLIVDTLTFSLMGLFLVVRTVIQVWRARFHLHRMRALYLPLLHAIHDLYPDYMPADRIVEWQYKRLNPELWMKALLQEIPQLKSRKKWQQVINHALDSIPLEKWQAAFPNIELHGRPSEFARTLAVAGIPVYGITTENEMVATLRAIQTQSVGFFKVLVVLNDPVNTLMRQVIPAWIGRQRNHDRWNWLDLPVANKKAAMASAARSFGDQKGKLFVNIDSDTIATRDALFFSLMSFVEFPFLHGITSNVRIRNLGRQVRGNWLKFLTYFRYDNVNNVERAARHFNETVLSGPWLVVRLDSYLSFIDDWINFQFRGKPVRPGDDRLITYFLNWLHLATTYVPQVVVYTDCPETWKRWKAQQTRWTQSYYIYMIKGFESGQAWELTPWSLLDLVYGGFFSFFLLGAVVGVILRTIPLIEAGDPYALASLQYYALTIFAANFARGAYSAITNRDIRGFIAATYVLPFVRYLVPIKLTKPFTLDDQGWLGRHNAA